ncbi:MAG: hypothetical protein QW555_08000 [Nitrososphaerota archaeon]
MAREVVFELVDGLAGKAAKYAIYDERRVVDRGKDGEELADIWVWCRLFDVEASDPQVKSYRTFYQLTVPVRIVKHTGEEVGGALLYLHDGKSEIINNKEAKPRRRKQ